jgi:hypothetical protein
MCTGFFGLIFGHDFEPRYSEARVDSQVHHPPPSAEQIQHMIDAAPGGEETEILNTFENMLRNGNNTQESQYVCEVCVRCGMIVRP